MGCAVPNLETPPPQKNQVYKKLLWGHVGLGQWWFTGINRFAFFEFKIEDPLCETTFTILRSTIHWKLLDTVTTSSRGDSCHCKISPDLTIWERKLLPWLRTSVAGWSQKHWHSKTSHSIAEALLPGSFKKADNEMLHPLDFPWKGTCLVECSHILWFQSIRGNSFHSQYISPWKPWLEVHLVERSLML